MPSSRTRWALDMDGDGRIDLHTSKADVVGSVAHYLASFGWQQGQPTHHAVTPPPQGPDLQTLLAPDIVPSFSAEQMAQRGAVLAEGARASPGLLALVELQNGDAPASYVAGTQNFYVVTRYNWSSYYAMAVIDLGAAVAEQRRAGSSSPAVAAKTAPKTAFKAAPKATRKAAPAAPNPRPQTKAGSR
jgi:membrane-bound lytic murein transglycosylase B